MNDGRAARSGRGGKRRRRAQGRPEGGQEPVREPVEMDAQSGLPAWLCAKLCAQYGDAVAGRVMAGLACKRQVTLRANALKATREAVAGELDAAGVGWRSVSWYDDAFVLDADRREDDVRALGSYERGELYLQSLSSMLPPLVLRPAGGTDFLDMCAAPGGKTTELCALGTGAAGSRGVHVTACEMNGGRADRLEHNLDKLGASSVQVMRCDARRLDGLLSFDAVLLDAPCTGSGTARAGDERLATRLTPALAARVERSQRALVDKAAEVLKPGGTLVYSTCSVLMRENEAVVSWALARHPDLEPVPVELPGCQLDPHGIHGGDPSALPTLPCSLPGALAVCPTALFEGFFVAALRKRA